MFVFLAPYCSYVQFINPTDLFNITYNNEFISSVAVKNGELNAVELAVLTERVALGGKVLTIAVLVILITAPIGAIAVMTAGLYEGFIGDSELE